MKTSLENGFVHLHLHTEYSLLDGGNRIRPLMKRVAELGMKAVAITDHGNLFGCAEFYREAQRAGIKPILGIEAYVAPGDRRNRTRTGGKDGGYHLVLLAETQQGWANLMKLNSDAYINGFYHKPRMDAETLKDWGQGLIAINGHLGSSLAHHLTQFEQTGNQSHWEAAAEEARWHRETFSVNATGDPCFYIELQRHGVPQQDAINPHLIKLAEELEIPLVCDNDAHFLNREDHETHDTLCCISMGKSRDDSSRLQYPRDIFVKSPAEMHALFEDVPDAVVNTVKIADRCQVDLDFNANHAPVVRVTGPQEAPVYDGSELSEWFNRWCARFELHPWDAQKDPDLDQLQLTSDCDHALRNLCEAGLIWRYGEDGITPEIRARCDRELGILSDKLISAYFLIVWDFVNWARQRGIPACARGSGVGTMVGYVLGLSNACPERYGLLFERFTDPDRSEYPDIDVDICQDGRAEVIRYVREKYGHVAQIITFGRLKARAAIKDVARVHGLPPSEGQRLANLVPDELNITIDEARQRSDEFRKEYEGNPVSRAVIDAANELEDHARHSGVHAAGVVVATQPLDNIVPLCKTAKSDDVMTQWDGPTCEQIGLLKMDFLGLRTLSTLELAKEHIRTTLSDEVIWKTVGRLPQEGPHPLDLERLVFDDPKVFDLFRRGETAGVFQFESGGMRQLLQQMKPDRIEDLIAANALYRPGPMELIDEYCLRKHGDSKVPTVQPIVDELTHETHGIMVYQEQVMQIVHRLGGVPLRDAYTLIKAISKKKHDVIDANREMFIRGSVQNGMTEDEANGLFELILKFAGYGFNKSHSTGYAIIAYQTAYLKTYFPVQYMAAVLTYESQAKKTEDWAPYLDECRGTRYPDHSDEKPHVGVEVWPPDINESEATFTVVYEADEPRDAVHGRIRFGLSAIKGVGRAAIDAIIKAREKEAFISLHDLCGKVPPKAVNRATLEALVKSGAMDSLHGAQRRAPMVEALDMALKYGQREARDREHGQGSLFGSGGETVEGSDPTELFTPLPSVPEWTKLEALGYEREVLGFHISGHPIDEFNSLVAPFRTATLGELSLHKPNTPVIVAGMISSLRYHTMTRGSNAGSRMAMIELQDRLGHVEAVLFAESFSKYGELVQTNQVVLAVGRVDERRGETQLIIEQLIRPHEAASFLADRIFLDIHGDNVSGIEDRLQSVTGEVKQAGGAQTADGARAASVFVRLFRDDEVITIKAGFKMVLRRNNLDRLESLLGGDDRMRILGVSPFDLVPKRNRSRFGQRT